MYLYSIAFCTFGASRKVNTFDLVIGVKLISHLLKMFATRLQLLQTCNECLKKELTSQYIYNVVLL